MTLKQAEKLAEKWLRDEITATKYYYRQARKAVNLYRNELSQDHHSALVGLIEFYNFHA